MDPDGAFQNSKYHDIDGISRELSSRNGYCMMHHNICSLPCKFDQLNEMITSLKIKDINLDLILLCETFLKDINYDLFPIENYNFIDKHRKDIKQGGVAIYINSDLEFIPREDLSIFEEGVFESVFVY